MKFCKVLAIMNVTDYNVLHEPIQRLDVPGVQSDVGRCDPCLDILRRGLFERL